MKKITSIDNKDSLLNFLKQTFNNISSNQIFAIIKILTGGLRVGVSEGILKECFVKLGSKNKYEIDEYWHAFLFHLKIFFIG